MGSIIKASFTLFASIARKIRDRGQGTGDRKEDWNCFFEFYPTPYSLLTKQLLVPQGGIQNSKFKIQNEYSVSVSLIWNGLFISAVLY
jgi:hypothetical protein